MSGSLLYVFLKRLNNDLNIIPIFHNENKKAHGLGDKEVMKYLLSVNPSVLFCPDSTTNDVKECKKLKNLGWDIYILDHHCIEKENPYATVINNQLGNVNNINGCGTLVTWHCCSYVNKKIANELISYVAIANIGDSMSMLSEENMTFKKWGLNRIHKNLKPFVEKLNKGNTPKDYSFGLITCFNSLIRLGTLEDKNNLFKGLCGELNEQGIQTIIDRCKELHTRQGSLVRKMFNDIESNVDNNGKAIIYILDEKTPLTGLVANKLLGKFNKPIILVHKRDSNEMAGSVRSPIPLKDLFNSTDLFNYNQGHLCAFGTSFQENKLEDVKEYINSLDLSNEPEVKVIKSKEAKEIKIKDLSVLYDYSEFWGKDIEEPLWHIKNITLNKNDLKFLGANSNTVKFSYKGIDFIKFFCSKNDIDNFNKYKNMNIEIVGTFNYNEWRGKKTPQVIISKYEIKEKEELSIDDIF